MNICLNCNKETLNNKFCSRSCATTVNNSVAPKRLKPPKNICKGCGVNTCNGTYCSNICQGQYVKKSKEKEWLADCSSYKSLPGSIRITLLEKANYKCSQCGWGERNIHTGKIPLEIDHIDGDSENNAPTNLRVLCPNCHSLTSTYKGANKVSKRTYRKKYYK
jgi:hypothetical protein